MQSDSGDLTARVRAIFSDISVREKKLWLELVVDIAIGLYFYPKAFALMLAAPACATCSLCCAQISQVTGSTTGCCHLAEC